MRKYLKILSACVLMLAISSCGKMSEMQKYVDKIEVSAQFGQVRSDAVLLEDIQDDVYSLQLALCDALSRAYEETDIDNLTVEYPSSKKEKVVSILNLRRQEISEELTTEFGERMAELVANVADCTNKQTYITKRRSEAVNFQMDYSKLNGVEDSKGFSDILIRYSDLENSFARRYLNENKDMLVAAAIETIEENAQQSSGLRALVAKNNSIVSALDTIFKTIKKSDADRINKANAELIVKLLNSMETLSADEKKRLMAQLESGEDMKIDIERKIEN